MENVFKVLLRQEQDYKSSRWFQPMKKSGKPKLVLLCPHCLGVHEGAPAGPDAVLTGSYCRSLRPLTSGPSGPVLEQGFHFKRRAKRDTNIMDHLKVWLLGRQRGDQSNSPPPSNILKLLRPQRLIWGQRGAYEQDNKGMFDWAPGWRNSRWILLVYSCGDIWALMTSLKCFSQSCWSLSNSQVNRKQRSGVSMVMPCCQAPLQ